MHYSFKGPWVVFSSMFDSPFAFSTEDFSDNDEMFAKQISKWNSNDLMDKMEASEAQGGTSHRPVHAGL